MTLINSLIEDYRKNIDFIVLIQSRIDNYSDLVSHYMEEGKSFSQAEELALNVILTDEDIADFIYNFISDDKKEIFHLKPKEMHMFDWYKFLNTQQILQ